MTKNLTIGGAPAQTGLSTDTLHYHESIGLLTPGTTARGRLASKEVHDRADERLRMLYALHLATPRRMARRRPVGIRRVSASAAWKIALLM